MDKFTKTEENDMNNNTKLNLGGGKKKNFLRNFINDIGKEIPKIPKPYPWKHRQVLQDFLTENGKSINASSIEMWALSSCAYLCFDTVYVPANARIEGDGAFVRDTQDHLIAVSDLTLDGTYRDLEATHVDIIMRTFEGASKRMVDFMTAYRRRDPKDTQLTHYYQMCGANIDGGPFVPFASFCGSHAEEVTQSQLERIKGIKWLGYRIQTCSSPTLVKRAFEEFWTMIGMQVDQRAVQAANNPATTNEALNVDPWQIYLSAVYYDACGFDYGDWYQGKRELSQRPAFLTKALRDLIKKYNKARLTEFEIDETNLESLRLGIQELIRPPVTDI